MHEHDDDEDDETLSYYDEDCLFLSQHRSQSSDGGSTITTIEPIRVELLWDMMDSGGSGNSAFSPPVSVVETDGDETWMDDDEGEDEEATLSSAIEDDGGHMERVLLVDDDETVVGPQDIFRPTTVLSNGMTTVQDLLPPHPVSPCTATINAQVQSL